MVLLQQFGDCVVSCIANQMTSYRPWSSFGKLYLLDYEAQHHMSTEKATIAKEPVFNTGKMDL